MAELPLTDYVVFKAGEDEFRVPALTLFTLEQVRGAIDSLRPDMSWIDYGKTVLGIFVRSMNPDATTDEFEQKQVEISRKLSIPQFRTLTSVFGELLTVSGFEMETASAGEVQATEPVLPGIGTPMPSQLN